MEQLADAGDGNYAYDAAAFAALYQRHAEYDEQQHARTTRSRAPSSSSA